MLILPLIACFLLASYYTTQAQLTDTKLITMQADGWSLKVDSTLATAVESNNKPFMTTLKDGQEKELFLILNSPTDAAQGKIEFKVETTGLTIYKQLPLNQELTVGQEYDFVNSTHAMLKGKTVVYRPENVVNSFACFDNLGQKALHIYASKLIDAKGASVWVDSDLKDGLLTVYLDSKFLDTATYPIIVDPIFGYNTIGGSSSDWATGLIGGSRTYLPIDSNLTQISVYLGTAQGNARVAIYNDSSNNPTTLIAESSSEAVSGTGWFNYTFNIHLESNKFYWLALQVDNTATKRYWDTSIAQGFGCEWTPYSAFDDSLPGGITQDVQYSIYGTYTELEITPTPTPTEEPTATPTPTVIYQAVPINYLNSVALIFLAIVCIALTIKPQVPILNFIFGVIVLGISALKE